MFGIPRPRTAYTHATQQVRVWPFCRGHCCILLSLERLGLALSQLCRDFPVAGLKTAYSQSSHKRKCDRFGSIERGKPLQGLATSKPPSLQRCLFLPFPSRQRVHLASADRCGQALHYDRGPGGGPAVLGFWRLAYRVPRVDDDGDDGGVMTVSIMASICIIF